MVSNQLQCSFIELLQTISPYRLLYLYLYFGYFSVDEVEAGMKDINITVSADSARLRESENKKSIGLDDKSKPNIASTTEKGASVAVKDENAESSNDSYTVKSETTVEPMEADDPAEMCNVNSDERSIRRSGRIRTIKTTRHREIKDGIKPSERKRQSLNVCDDDSQGMAGTDSPMDGQANVSQTFEGLVKTQEQLEKEQLDREVGLRSFVNIIDSEYRSERLVSKEAKKMTCDCFLTHTEHERGESGCGDDCLNRMLLIECGPKCTVGDRCSNRRFQRHENADCTILKTEKKGYGLFARSYIPSGVFIMEYVGEVLNAKQFEKRANDYSKLMNAHYYFMALRNDCIIDATKKGNVSRFINHSCEPNAETQKWTVNGELRIGFFSSRSIMPDEEITFDYQFQRYGKEAQKCFCEATNCRGWIGGEPDSEEELAEDSSNDEDESDEGEEQPEKVVSSKEEIDPQDVVETIKKKTKVPRARKPKDVTKKPVRKERPPTVKPISKNFKKHMNRSEIMQDPDLDMEIDDLAQCGLKNQVQTLQFSRLMGNFEIDFYLFFSIF